MSGLSLPKPYIIPADIGTTSTKTLVIDRSGRVLASHAVEYPLYTPKPDMAEQDPDEIFQAVLAAIREVVGKAAILPGQVLCVSFSSAMHSFPRWRSSAARPGRYAPPAALPALRSGSR
ncbi:FGGY family carbohydrate kinase [Paenibacillus sp. MZ04-78.2]|nr:FGGY family carbohydrate kinase [Paenibacillus sp. MZ04-78.2]MCP3771832.1 FGGY family carbohydrate kinase [Paenibacillus sp. MZ04-78.2]